MNKLVSIITALLLTFAFNAFFFPWMASSHMNTGMVIILTIVDVYASWFIGCFLGRKLCVVLEKNYL
jgi:hypothetical protein